MAGTGDDGQGLEAQSVELLQTMIRNACVNDGTRESGQETRNVATLNAFLGGSALDIETYEPLPGRTSLIASIDPPSASAPTLVYLAHTDVVPADPAGWKRDPFGGELVDGEIWGRGAVDMLNLTSTMAVATRSIAAGRTRPSCGLIYAAVADEEASGTWGAGWLVENVSALERATGVVTEFGGMPEETPSGPKYPVVVGEKGANWCRIVVHGTPGHGSQPYRSDNALVKAARLVGRLADARVSPQVLPIWETYIRQLELPEDLTSSLVNPNRIDEAIAELPAGLAAVAHACTHMTIAPTVAHGGQKVNIIPATVEIQVDIRLLPGEDPDSVPEAVRELAGDLAGDIEIIPIVKGGGTISATDTPLWDALSRATGDITGGRPLIPMLLSGSTDARYFRERGVPAYGFGLFSPRITLASFAKMFHGNDERVDTDSLRLSAQLFRELPERYGEVTS